MVVVYEGIVSGGEGCGDEGCGGFVSGDEGCVGFVVVVRVWWCMRGVEGL